MTEEFSDSDGESRRIGKDGFLSHAYGESNVTHERVLRIQQTLWKTDPAAHTWIDEQQLPYGQDLRDRIRSAILSCNCFLLFLTNEYQEKVFDKNIARNWCRYEYGVACDENKPILIVLMDSDLRNPRTWHPDLRVDLGGLRYFDMSDPSIYENPEVLMDTCSVLARIIRTLGVSRDVNAAILSVLKDDDYCPTHGDFCEYYDVPCQKTICQKCAMTNHEGHLKVMVDDKAQEIKTNNFNECVNILNGVIDRFLDCTRNIQNKKQNLKEKFQTDIDHIRNTFAEIRNAINSTENNFIDKLEKEFSMKTEVLDEMMQDVTSRLGTTQTILQQFNKSAVIPSNGSLVRCWVNITKEKEKMDAGHTPYDFPHFNVDAMTLTPPSYLDLLTPSHFYPQILQLDEIDITKKTPFKPPIFDSSLPVSYSISFDVTIEKTSTAWRNILCHGTGKYPPDAGSRHPALWISPNNTTLTVIHGTESSHNYGWSLKYHPICGERLKIAWSTHAGTMKVYINGKLDSQGTTATTDPFIWGTDGATWSWDVYFTLADNPARHNGYVKVKNVLWWNRELSEKEMEIYSNL